LFVGGGVAYAVHAAGYNTFNLDDPEHPLLIAAGNTQQFDWKQMALNGSGLAVAAVERNAGETLPHDVWLYDASDPNQTDVFLTSLATPGIARSVSIYNGLAYIADGAAGLQVMNYLAFDTKKQPPTIALTTSFALSAPTTGTAEEAKFTRVTANVTDNVQVRNVEFYIDGQLAVADGNYPFEYRFLTPKPLLWGR
jgi:hypothetical protein